MTWNAPPSRSANGTSGGIRCTPSSTTLMFSAIARSTTARTPTQTRTACSSNARSTGLAAGASAALAGSTAALSAGPSKLDRWSPGRIAGENTIRIT